MKDFGYYLSKYFIYNYLLFIYINFYCFFIIKINNLKIFFYLFKLLKFNNNKNAIVFIIYYFKYL